MNNAFLFHYNTSKADEEKDFHIRGIGVHETMPPGLIRHGDEQYPWLFIYFHSPALVRTPSGSEKCDHSLMIWEPRQIHHYGNELSQWDHSWLIVKAPSIRPLLENSSITLNTPMDVEAGEIFEKYLTLLHSEVKHPVSSRYLLEHFLELFLFELNRILKGQYVPVPQNLQAIAQYLNRNLDRPLTIGDLAETFHISPPYLMARFKECYGISPMLYLNQRRMERAALLLQNSPYSCKEIAERTGFGDPLYFSRRFRQFWGFSPREYRKKNTALPTPSDDSDTIGRLRI